ncbi:surface-adhesin E family protein [Brevundimonas sp. M1A4_2e]|uniref:surface-adhesin E family protein n=1 Tax=Brevundimonas huaxiensis TaxID=2725493 RepID=UPI0012DBFDDE|nr:surface-adhesin E family protein [Brevundimonas huaxiensis]MBC1184054.1 hypothetical protein [Brevundimonas huaxiensis]
MKAKQVLTIAAALSSASGIAWASDWRLVEVSSTKATAVEMSTVVHSDGRATAWTAMMLPLTVSGMDYALSLAEYDCEARTTKPLSVVWYDGGGQLVTRSDLAGPAVASGDKPTESLILKAVCTNEFVKDGDISWATALSLFRMYRNIPAT